MKIHQAITFAALLTACSLTKDGVQMTGETHEEIQALQDSRRAMAKSELVTLNAAVSHFAINNGGVDPESLEMLVLNDVNGNSYLEQTVVPKDAWENEYHYQPRQAGQERQLFTYGADGVAGGEGEDLDITIQQVLSGEL